MIALSRFFKSFVFVDSFKANKTDALVGMDSFHPLQSLGYSYALQLLNLAVQKGILELSCIRSVCDFGAGTGGPALALRNFLKLSLQNLTLLEEYPPQVVLLRKLFPKDKVVSGNGLAWFANCRKQYDLITAFMLGPDYDDDGFAFELIHRALHCLSPQGKLLICSDTATMQVVKGVLEGKPELVCQWLVLDPEEAAMPVTVIVSKLETKQQLSFVSTVHLPPIVMKSASIPDSLGHWTTEHYSLSTPFERAYLQATIAAFEAEKPEHPGIIPMKALLDETH